MNTDTHALRVLFLINHAGNGGSEKYVYNLVQAYEGNGAKCFFVYNEAGKLSEQMQELNIPSFHLMMRNPFDFSAAKQLAKLCRENKIDVIHAQYPRENYIALLSKRYYKNPRVVYTCHLMAPTPAWYKPLNRWMSKKNHRIIAVCNPMRAHLISIGMRAEKIRVIYNGILPKPERASGGIRKALSIPEDAFVITTLARYDRVKRLDLLTEAVHKFKQITDKPFRVLYVGDGDLFDEVKAQIQNLGLENEVLQLGFRTDTDDILSESDLFVNASENEALSFAILEALSHALPVVATNIGGNPDILSPEHDCGILVEFGDTEEMANAFLRLQEDKVLYDRCSANAQTAANTVFNLKNILEDTFAVYH